MGMKFILVGMALPGVQDVNAGRRALGQSAWDARVLSSDGVNAVQMMQRAPLNRPVISFT